ncbi:Uncharacterized protein TCM_032626 [Theobroma cacao]|uniref:Uncharacterized protein n=1 Tax=Theobroma cacao TaxID=3641 RepID=A0A061F971_THECC|nr:Uncharacterized protein TCM_032626 [Theobroma cacao]
MEQMEDNGNKVDIISSQARFLSNPSRKKGGDVVIQSSQIHLSSPVENQLPASAIPPAIQESPGPGLNDKAYLLKVPHHMRQVNESAYEPQLISIGPYYHGANKAHLKEMEVYKTRCLQRILERKGEQSKDRCVKAMNLERARKRYSPSLSNDIEDKFGRMIPLDWCFIVELLSGKVPGDDPFFKLKWVLNALYHDLLLFENQLPFFVLVGLYHVIKDPTYGKDFTCHAFSILSDFLPGPKKWNKTLLPSKILIISSTY